MDISLPISLASGILAVVLAAQAYHAFSYAKKAYLLNFSVGFLLLGVSYIVLIPFALGVKLPPNFGDADDIVNYPVFAVMQTIGYMLIALGYSQTIHAKQILICSIGALLTILVVVFLPGIYVQDSVDIFLYLLNTVLLAFVLYHMLKVLHPTDLVFVGFLLLALHEYTALIASANEIIYSFPDDGSFLIAELLRLSGLCILLVSFLVGRTRIRPSIEVVRNAESAQKI